MDSGSFWKKFRVSFRDIYGGEFIFGVDGGNKWDKPSLRRGNFTKVSIGTRSRFVFIQREFKQRAKFYANRRGCKNHDCDSGERGGEDSAESFNSNSIYKNH